MKRFLAISLIFSLLLGSLAACKNKPEPEQPSSSESEYTYKDGEYSVAYSTPAHDRTLDYLTISVLADKITIKDYSCTEDPNAAAESSGAESSSSGASSSAPPSSPESSGNAQSSTPESLSSKLPASGETEYEAKVRDQMLLIREEYDAVGGDLDQMELITGTDEHFHRFQRMMRTAIRSAKTGDTQKKMLGRYENGTYEAVMPEYDIDGWKEYLRVSVKDGEISEIEFDATKLGDDNVKITADPASNPTTLKNPPSTYYPAITKAFIDAGSNIADVMIPPGGTAAFFSFKKLVAPTISNMISGGTTRIVAPMYVDGVYKAQLSEFDEFGWKDYITLKITNGVVSVKEFDAFHKTDPKKLKSTDLDNSAKWEAATGISPIDMLKRLFESFDRAKGDVINVDNVAGATVSVNSFKLLAGEILATTALYGNSDETLEVVPLTSEQSGKPASASSAASSSPPAASSSQAAPQSQTPQNQTPQNQTPQNQTPQSQAQQQPASSAAPSSSQAAPPASTPPPASSKEAPVQSEPEALPPEVPDPSDDEVVELPDPGEIEKLSPE